MNLEVPSPLLQLIFRADLGILVGRWGYQPEPAQLPGAYEELTQAVMRSSCRFWLQDIRRRSLNDPQTTQWLLNDYFPSMAVRLGGQLCVAYLVSPALHQTIMQQSNFLPPEAYENKPFAVGFFGDEGAAIQWLEQKQRRTAG